MKTYDIISMRRVEAHAGEMQELARAHFEGRPEAGYVLIRELGGWYLGFRRDMSIWSTANDCAILDDGPRPEAWSGCEVFPFRGVRS